MRSFERIILSRQFFNLIMQKKKQEPVVTFNQKPKRLSSIHVSLKIKKKNLTVNQLNFSQIGSQQVAINFTKIHLKASSILCKGPLKTAPLGGFFPDELKYSINDIHPVPVACDDSQHQRYRPATRQPTPSHANNNSFKMPPETA